MLFKKMSTPESATPKWALWALILSMSPLPGCSAALVRAPEPDGIKLVPSLVLEGPELFMPTDVAVNDAGWVHVLDAGNYRLYTYAPSGRLHDERGRRGEGPEEFPFLRPGQSELAVSNGKAAVMMAGAQRVLVWNLSTDVASTFRIAAYPTSLAFSGSTLYMSVASTALSQVDASVYAYSLDGTPESRFGDRFQPAWDDPSTHHLVRLQNRSILAASPQGLVFEAGQWWPWIRAYGEQIQLWEYWPDYSWFGDPKLRVFFGRTNETPEGFSYADIEANVLSSAPRIFDLAASDQALFALLGNSRNVQVFDNQGTPGATYWLLPVGVDPDDAVRDPFPTPKASSIGVSPDGSHLCTASYHTARVLCYKLPPSLQAASGF